MKSKELKFKIMKFRRFFLADFIDLIKYKGLSRIGISLKKNLDSYMRILNSIIPLRFAIGICSTYRFQFTCS